MDYNSYQGRSRDKISGALRPLTYLPNVSEWVDKIYRIEDATDQYTADQVLGGANGIVNAPIQALGNRTYWLLDKLERLSAVVSAMQVALSPILTTIKALTVQPVEVDDYDYQAWLKLEEGYEADVLYAQMPGGVPSNVRLVFADGSHIDKPVIELTLENGQVVYIRTDGNSSVIPDVEPISEEE